MASPLPPQEAAERIRLARADDLTSFSFNALLNSPFGSQALATYTPPRSMVMKKIRYSLRVLAPAGTNGIVYFAVSPVLQSATAPFIQSPYVTDLCRSEAPAQQFLDFSPEGFYVIVKTPIYLIGASSFPLGTQVLVSATLYMIDTFEQ